MLYFPSTWKRILAKLLDEFYVSILQAPIFIVLIYNYIKMDEWKLHGSHVVYFLLIRVIYESICISFFSATLGKKQLGLKVISRHLYEKSNLSFDSKIEWSQAILRSLVGQLSFFFGWSLYVTAFFKYNRTHLGDWLAETQVVSLVPRATKPKIRFIMASLFILLTLPESLTSASSTLSLIRFKNPYFYFDCPDFKKSFENFNFQFELDSTDEDDSDLDEEDSDYI